MANIKQTLLDKAHATSGWFADTAHNVGDTVRQSSTEEKCKVFAKGALGLPGILGGRAYQYLEAQRKEEMAGAYQHRELSFDESMQIANECNKIAAKGFSEKFNDPQHWQKMNEIVNENDTRPVSTLSNEKFLLVDDDKQKKQLEKGLQEYLNTPKPLPAEESKKKPN